MCLGPRISGWPWMLARSDMGLLCSQQFFVWICVWFSDIQFDLGFSQSDDVWCKPQVQVSTRLHPSPSSFDCNHSQKNNNIQQPYPSYKSVDMDHRTTALFEEFHCSPLFTCEILIIRLHHPWWCQEHGTGSSQRSQGTRSGTQAAPKGPNEISQGPIKTSTKWPCKIHGANLNLCCCCCCSSSSSKLLPWTQQLHIIEKKTFKKNMVRFLSD